jgi:hypothetical protein
METKTRNNWYISNGSFDQAIVIDEITGETIAVSYKSKNAPMIACAPEAVELLEETLEMLRNMTSEDFSMGKDKEIRTKIANFLSNISGN